MPYVLHFVHIAVSIITLSAVLAIKEQGSTEKGAVLSDADLKEQSSNQISVKEEEKAKAGEQVYYLPLQTVFGETHTTLVGAGSLSTTLPPHISIDPAPILTEYPGSTSAFYEDVPAKEYNAASQCVSETPVMELESRFLFLSKDTIKESVIMSGHSEVPSKTSSAEEASEAVSKPSVVLQGTEFYSHTMTDL